MTRDILVNMFYLLAIINPVSKICILSVFASKEEKTQIKAVSFRSSLISLLILGMAIIAGDFVMQTIFHVELYSLRVAGGIVLCLMGYKALAKGVFFESEATSRFADLSIVPLACPMIAGPATIAASLALAAEAGTLITITAISIAVFINFGLMLCSAGIGKVLTRFNIMGALIRITGLIVMTIGIQMILSGITNWVQNMRA